MTPRERDHIAGLCASLAGLDVPTEHSYLMESRLAGLARREGFASISDLAREIKERNLAGPRAHPKHRHVRRAREPERNAREQQHQQKQLVHACLRRWSLLCTHGNTVNAAKHSDEANLGARRFASIDPNLEFL